MKAETIGPTLQVAAGDTGGTMEPKKSAFAFNIIMGWVPDLALCWGAAKLTDSGWPGFFWAFLALQAIYLFFWLKNAVWHWALYWLYRKRQMVAHLENFLIDSRLPPPDEYTWDLEEYFGDIANNEEIDGKTRARAAFELGTINGFRASQRYSLLLQVTMAGSTALKRYARLSNRFASQSAD